MDGLDRGQFSGEVQKIEDQIRRRLPLGSRISERHLREELAKQVCVFSCSLVQQLSRAHSLSPHGPASQDFNPHAIAKAIFLLTQKDVLSYKDRRMSLVRVKI